MKTIEEMKSVVIAYCEEVCPQIKNEYFPLGATDDGARALYLRKSATFFNDPKTAYHVLCCKGQEHVLSKETLASASDETVMLFYRLLGLAERDAVAEKGQQCRQMIEATISAANAKINALEARNTALVVALEIVKYGCEFGNQSLGCQKLPDGKGYSAVIGSPYEFVCDALQAYKKGGVQG